VLLLTSPARGLDGSCWEEVSPQGVIKHCGDHRPQVPHHHTQEAHREEAHRETETQAACCAAAGGTELCGAELRSVSVVRLSMTIQSWS
jgi:hypothetical protein